MVPGHHVVVLQRHLLDRSGIGAEGRLPSNGQAPVEWRSQPLSSEHELGAQHKDQGSVGHWLATYRQAKPEHCAALYDRYRAWCAHQGLVAASDRKFFALLVELGARKYRDGRNGPMIYALPGATSVRQLEQEGARS